MLQKSISIYFQRYFNIYSLGMIFLVVITGSVRILLMKKTEINLKLKKKKKNFIKLHTNLQSVKISNKNRQRELKKMFLEGLLNYYLRTCLAQRTYCSGFDFFFSKNCVISMPRNRRHGLAC